MDDMVVHARALTVDRDLYQVGAEVFYSSAQREESAEATIIGVDWNRGAGPIVMETDDNHIYLGQPWEVTLKPTTIEEIDAYLGL